MEVNNFNRKIEEEIQYSKATQALVKEEQSELKKLLAENLRYNKAIYADTQKIRRYMFWRMIINIVWIIIIILPIIVAIIWLPPLLGNFISQYENVVGGTGTTDLGGTLDLLNKLKGVK